MREHGASTMNIAEKIGFDVIPGHFIKSSEERDGRIVHPHVDATKSFHGSLRQLLDSFTFTDIGRNSHRGGAKALAFIGYSLKLLFTTGSQHKTSALTSEIQGRRATYPTRSPSYNDNRILD
jgi:hypothetical protein